jgi:hypothetical protein
MTPPRSGPDEYANARPALTTEPKPLLKETDQWFSPTLAKKPKTPRRAPPALFNCLHPQ